MHPSPDARDAGYAPVDVGVAGVAGEAGDAGDAPVVLAIDGNSLVHRSYHAQARTGQPMWAVRGLLMQLVAAVERVRPAAVVIGFDDPLSSVRRTQWPAYKAQRDVKLESLVEQLALAVEVMRDLGLAVLVPDGLEADDVLASTAAAAPGLGMRTVIVTSDRDAFALIDDRTRVLRIINGGVDASPMMTADRLELLIGIRPHQYRDYAALRGDPSDNLPGVRGVGPRTAARLLQLFGTARAAFDDLDLVHERLGAGVAARLRAPGSRDAWALNCEIMTMHADIALALDPGAGPGVMPLAADAVSRTYYAQNLTWTAKDALRVLAEVEPEAAERMSRLSSGGVATAGAAASGRSADRRAGLPSWVSGADDRFGAANGRGRRPLPKLPPRKPVAAQLSLF